MYFTLKESKMTAWWVAKEKNLMAFFDICANKELPDDLVVVGFMKDSYPDLAKSTNKVVKVTDKGVITAKGSFYPIEEAHALYINFLVNANATNVIKAFNWELRNGRMTADIVRNGEIENGVTFDFDPYHSNRNDIGYSDELKTDVVVSPFSRRGVCIKLSIPFDVRCEMRNNADFEYESEKKEYISLVQKLINSDEGDVIDTEPMESRREKKKKEIKEKKNKKVEELEKLKEKKKKELEELEEKIKKMKSEL